MKDATKELRLAKEKITMLESEVHELREYKSKYYDTLTKLAFERRDVMNAHLERDDAKHKLEILLVVIRQCLTDEEGKAIVDLYGERSKERSHS